MVTAGEVDGPEKDGDRPSGRRRQVGTGGQRGQRVGTGRRRCFATVMTWDILCYRKADSLSFDDAVTMPEVYLTAIYSVFMGRLERGQVRISWASFSITGQS